MKAQLSYSAGVQMFTDGKSIVSSQHLFSAMNHAGWCRGPASYSAMGTTSGRDHFTARLTSRSSDFILSPWQEILSQVLVCGSIWRWSPSLSRLSPPWTRTQQLARSHGCRACHLGNSLCLGVGKSPVLANQFELRLLHASWRVIVFVTCLNSRRRNVCGGG